MSERVIFVVLLVLASGAFAVLPILGQNNCLSSQSISQGLPVERPVPTDVFAELSDLRGSNIHPQEFAGRWSVVMFGYLGCTDVCHTQSMVMRQLAGSPDLPKELQFAYIAMDPEQDADKLSAYFPETEHNKLRVLLPKSLKHAQQIALAMGTPFSRSKNQEQLQAYLSHPGYVLLIDPSRTVRLVYPSSTVNAISLASDLARINQLSTSRDDGSYCT